MKKKSVMKIIAALAIGAMLTGSLAGCGGKEEGSQGNAGNEKQSGSEAGGENKDANGGAENKDDGKAQNEAGGSKDIYSMTKEDLEGRKLTITSAEDWWHPPYQTLVDKYM